MVVDLIFYVLACAVLLGAVMVVISNNPIRSALFLVATFFANAGIWLLTGAEFLALILVLVYVGAVMTLFLFVIMMLEVDRIFFKPRLWGYLGGMVMVATVLISALVVLAQWGFESAIDVNQWWLWSYHDTERIAAVLYTEYAYPFVLAGVLLLVAMIAAVALVLRPAPHHIKRQHPGQQVRVQKADRLRLDDGEAQS